MREVVLFKLVSFLNGKGFTVNSFFDYNSCFDLIAKRNNFTLIVKVYSNIDAVRPEQALELLKLGKTFNAMALVIGEKTRLGELKKGEIYERHSIPVMSFNTFSSVLDSFAPSVRHFKGKTIVELDYNKLREGRAKEDLSLEELARKVGITKESLYRFEHGHSTSIGTARKLEKALGVDLVLEKNLLDSFFQDQLEREKRMPFDSMPKDESIEKIHYLGLDVFELQHSPFRAVGSKKEFLLIDKGKEKQELKKKALVLEKAKAVFDSHSLIITKKYKIERISGTPVIQEEELDSYSRINELLAEIKRREKK
ncbi:MAG: helix-turn-helix domain-containing protein [Candidatus Diapherotrites archaeon]